MRIEELGAKKEVTFEDCKLDRKKYAEALTNIISGFEKGGVIALNNKWGTGKTTFVKMWQHYLEEKQYQTIYFNAWENDFEDNALAALISELTEKIKGEKEELIDVAAKFLTNVGVGTGKIIVDRLLGSGASDHLKDITDLSPEHILKDDIKNYKNKKDSIKEFKRVLESYIERNAQDPNKKANIIFFIDELDRCRPNYAVKLLEIIKHFFTVPNIIFVLSIDKEQLGYAIQGVYGSSKIDSDEYLRRFIDIEYNLPAVNTKQYIRFLLEKTGINHDFISIYYDEVVLKINTLSSIFFHKNTLRQNEKMIINLKLITQSDPGWINKHSVQILIFLLFLKYNRRSLYIKYINRDIEIETFDEFFFEIYNGLNREQISDDLMCFIEASLLLGYIYLDRETMGENFKKIKSSSDEFLYQSKINTELLKEYFDNEERENRYNISTIINYIELIPE